MDYTLPIVECPDGSIPSEECLDEHVDNWNGKMNEVTRGFADEIIDINQDFKDTLETCPNTANPEACVLGAKEAFIIAMDDAINRFKQERETIDKEYVNAVTASCCGDD